MIWPPHTKQEDYGGDIHNVKIRQAATGHLALPPSANVSDTE